MGLETLNSVSPWWIASKISAQPFQLSSCCFPESPLDSSKDLRRIYMQILGFILWDFLLSWIFPLNFQPLLPLTPLASKTGFLFWVLSDLAIWTEKCYTNLIKHSVIPFQGLNSLQLPSTFGCSSMPSNTVFLILSRDCNCYHRRINLT